MKNSTLCIILQAATAVVVGVVAAAAVTASIMNNPSGVALMAGIAPTCHDNSTAGPGTLLISFFQSSSVVDLFNQGNHKMVGDMMVEAYNLASPLCDERFKRKMLNATYEQSFINPITGYLDTYWDSNVLCNPHCPYPDPYFGATLDSIDLRRRMLEEYAYDLVNQTKFLIYFNAMVESVAQLNLKPGTTLTSEEIQALIDGNMTDWENTNSWEVVLVQVVVNGSGETIVVASASIAPAPTTPEPSVAIDGFTDAPSSQPSPGGARIDGRSEHPTQAPSSSLTEHHITSWDGCGDDATTFRCGSIMYYCPGVTQICDEQLNTMTGRITQFEQLDDASCATLQQNGFQKQCGVGGDSTFLLVSKGCYGLDASFEFQNVYTTGSESWNCTKFVDIQVESPSSSSTPSLSLFPSNTITPTVITTEIPSSSSTPSLSLLPSNTITPTVITTTESSFSDDNNVPTTSTSPTLSPTQSSSDGDENSEQAEAESTPTVTPGVTTSFPSISVTLSPTQLSSDGNNNNGPTEAESTPTVTPIAAPSVPSFAEIEDETNNAEGDQPGLTTSSPTQALPTSSPTLSPVLEEEALADSEINERVQGSPTSSPTASPTQALPTSLQTSSPVFEEEGFIDGEINESPANVQAGVSTPAALPSQTLPTSSPAPANADVGDAASDSNWLEHKWR